MSGEKSPEGTLARVIELHGRDWLRENRVPLRIHRVLRAIAVCQTPAMGGRRQWCACGYQRYVFFSCRNRHCPQCQSFATESWRQARQSELLPVPYFHNVFTLPHELNRLILWNEQSQRALLKLLFDAVAQTLLEFGRNELGGQVGFTSVLHTWDQQLRPHFHIHCLMASGALADGGTRWVAGGRRFLFSVRALSKVFRGKFLSGLEELWQSGGLDLPPDLAPLRNAEMKRWIRRLRKHSWVVYSKEPFASPARLLNYLSRYTHRVAISNDRILSVDDDNVTFRYRDRRDGDRSKTQVLSAHEFIDRFSKHVLPDRFMRIRHYGFLASRNKGTALKRIRELLGGESWTPSPPTLEEWLTDLLGLDSSCCPSCGAPLMEQQLTAIPFSGDRLPSFQQSPAAGLHPPRPPP